MDTPHSSITVQALIDAPIETVWESWTSPADIMQWNNASDDWHTTRSENDLSVGGRFISRMEAKNGTMGFDFAGIYNVIKTHERLEYTLDDGRKVNVSFVIADGKIKITETFEAESTNPIAMQRDGWQAILNNFKKYAEAK